MELGRQFHQPPWVFENAPFHWYRALRRWVIWQHRDRDEPYDVDLVQQWTADRITGDYT